MKSAIIEDEALLAEFVAESREQLANIDDNMIALEHLSLEELPAAVNTVFRVVHSIKGAAGFFGLSKINALTHALEDVLNQMRNGRLFPTRASIDTCLRAIDLVGVMLNDTNQEAACDISHSVAELGAINNIDALAALGAPSVAASVESTTPPTSRHSDIKPETLRDFLLEGYENLAQIDLDLESLDLSAPADATIRSIFRGIHSIKGAAGFLGFQQVENVTHATESLLGKVRANELQMTEAIRSAVGQTTDCLRSLLSSIESTGCDEHVDIRQVLATLHTRAGTAALPTAPPPTIRPQASPAQPIATPLSTTLPSAGEAALSAPAQDKTSVADSALRVDVALLDRLMNHVGELVLARNRVLQLCLANPDPAFQQAAQSLNLITSELQEGVMKTRMQPIGNAWSKFPRVVRDLALQCGKEVRLEMEGRETELDKTIIEAIRDPLTHLVRNSIDHGIESPEARRASGKSSDGCLRLRAYHEGGQVIIEVSDDGQGLNYSRIRQKAAEKDLLPRDQIARLSDHQTAQLIFLPGFSTAEKVTHVSGRGVGMDVVKTNIEKIGGVIEISSAPGKGTTINIKIPLTLAIVPALVVTVGEERFAIPQAGLVELVRLEGIKAKIEYLHNAPVFRLREQLLPIVSLRSTLELAEPTADSIRQPECLNIVVLKADDRQFGLVVDDVCDTAEIVVKPLNKSLKGIAVYAGATVMGDGRVALILDVLGLARHAGVFSQHAADTRAVRESNHNSKIPCETLLICELGQGRRAAFPISSVSRLEEIPRAALEWAEETQVVQYRGGFLTIVQVTQLLSLPTSAAVTEVLNVVVCRHASGHIGLVVDHILDVLEAPLELLRQGHRPGIRGSAVLNSVVVDVVDVPYLVAQAAEQSSLGLV